QSPAAAEHRRPAPALLTVLATSGRGVCGGRSCTNLALAEDLAEASLQRDRDRRPDRALLEPLDQGLEEALDDQPLRILVGQAVRAQVVELLGVDLRHCGG